MLLSSPALRKLGATATTEGSTGSLATRKTWGGAGVLGTLFTPSEVRGLSRDAQVMEAAVAIDGDSSRLAIWRQLL